MSHERFDIAKQKYMQRGMNETAASVLAFTETGETDGSVTGSDIEVDTSSWTEDDFYKQNLALGMDEHRARFNAAISFGSIDINNPEIDY